MQLNRFTDLGIRVLLLLSVKSGEVFKISQLADTLQVSKNHLMKVVHFLAKQQWLITIRGKNGGIKLMHSLEYYRLGQTIQALERYSDQQQALINCQEPRCVLLPSCSLGSILQDALQNFYNDLDCYTLSDIVSVPISQTINISIDSITKS